LALFQEFFALQNTICISDRLLYISTDLSVLSVKTHQWNTNSEYCMESSIVQKCKDSRSCYQIFRQVDNLGMSNNWRILS